MQNRGLDPVLSVGIDVGSTTTKIVVLDGKQILYSDYRRHHAAQIQSVHQALMGMKEHFPGRKIRLALTGSGFKLIADHLDEGDI